MRTDCLLNLLCVQRAHRAVGAGGTGGERGPRHRDPTFEGQGTIISTCFKAEKANKLRAQLQESESWVQIPAQPLTRYVTWGELLNCSEPQFLHLKNRKNYSDLPQGESMSI